jgi:hypothetical protein
MTRAGYGGGRQSERKNPAGEAVPTHPGRNFLVCLTVAFLACYLAGLFACRSGCFSSFGNLCAQYYLDKQNFSVFRTVFAALYAAAFLQLSCIILCGFSVFGSPCLLLLFAAKGGFLGVCAAALYLSGGIKGMLLYWLMTFLPEITLLMLELWLVEPSYRICRELFQTVFGNRAFRVSQSGAVKAMVTRYLISLLGGILLSVGGAGISCLFAGVLL